MRKIVTVLAIVLISVLGTFLVMRRPAKSGFSVDDFLAVTLEYSSPLEIVGVDTYGPADKAFQCERSVAAAIAQSHDMLPKGHMMTATCLHLKLDGPLGIHGAVIAQPFEGVPLEVIAIGVEFTHAGKFFGAEALHKAPDVATCVREGHEVIESNHRQGKIPAGNSLLIYCMPVPVMPASTDDSDGDSV